MRRKLLNSSSILINWVLVFAVLLFLFTELTPFEIQFQPIKSFAYYGMILLPGISIMLNLTSTRKAIPRYLGSTFASILFVSVLVIDPIKILFSIPVWETREVLYMNGHLPFKKIEKQFQDRGSLGYKSRIVEVTYLTSLFMLIEPINYDPDKRVEWVRLVK